MDAGEQLRSLSGSLHSRLNRHSPKGLLQPHSPGRNDRPRSLFNDQHTLRGDYTHRDVPAKRAVIPVLIVTAHI